jgi:hypothetical protein
VEPERPAPAEARDGHVVTPVVLELPEDAYVEEIIEGDVPMGGLEVL